MSIPFIVNASLAGVADTTAPVLSALLAAKIGSTSWTAAVDTDEANGTLFYVVTQNATENPATVLAGASQSVTQTGQQTISGMGLAPSTTYRVHALHQDAAGNSSAVLSSNTFTTDELGSGSGTVTIEIMNRSEQQVAPEAVWFRANVSDASVNQNLSLGAYDESFHKLTYIWDFGDPGAASDKVVNVPVAHNDLNKAYGKQAAHVYRSPGAYTVTCTVYAENRTLIGSDTFQITVNDPDAHFTGNRNILLKPDGQPEAAYPGAQVVTSVQAARDRVMQTAGACRILIPRGITITTTQTFQITNPATTNLYIASYGTGARPVLSIDANAIGANNGYGGDIVITGMQFNGPYDELTQTGATRIFLNVRDSPGGGRMNLIDDCIVDGYRHVYYPTGGYAENVWTMTVIHNSLSRNAGLYHIFADGNWENVAVLGCPFAHNPLAAATGATQDAKQNSQGTMRMTGRARVILSVCELFSKFGWGTGTYTEEQSCVRNNTSNRPEYMIICDRVVFESGWEVFNTGDNQSSNHEVNNILLEKCLLLGSSTTLTLIQVGNTGITARNTIMVRPNSPYRDRSWDAFLAAHTDNFADPNSRLSCINCTFVQAQSAANHSGAPQATIWDANGKTFNTFENLNGVVYTPNNPSAQPFDPQFDALDLPVAGGGDFNPRYAGYRQRNEALQTQFATPDDAVKLWRPAVGSPLIGAATGVVAYDDYLGNVRPASASPGAVEAA